MCSSAASARTLAAGPDDLCAMPYTSGTTGEPRGCMHTHRSTMHTLVAGMRWFSVQPEHTLMSVAPLFHVTGMQGGMNGPLYAGATVILLPRWDRRTAAECVQRYRISGWTAIPTMVQDFFANPDIARYDLSSIKRLSGGGAAMPAAVAQRLLDMGLPYIEGYGLSETMAATHLNPVSARKSSVSASPYTTSTRGSSIPSPCASCRRARSVKSSRMARRYSRVTGINLATPPKPHRDRRQTLPAHRRPRQNRRGRVLLHGRPAEANDQRAGFKVWPAEVESRCTSTRRYWRPV